MGEDDEMSFRHIMSWVPSGQMNGDSGIAMLHVYYSTATLILTTIWWNKLALLPVFLRWEIWGPERLSELFKTLTTTEGSHSSWFQLSIIDVKKENAGCESGKQVGTRIYFSGFCLWGVAPAPQRLWRFGKSGTFRKALGMNVAKLPGEVIMDWWGHCEWKCFTDR